MVATTQGNNTNNANHHPREWHVYYSKAKQREYYFDPVSQESTWVLPANANRVTDVRENEGDAFSFLPTLRKLFLLGVLLIFSLWLSTRQFPFSNVLHHDSNESASSERTINQPPSALLGKDSDVTITQIEDAANNIPETFPSSWKKVLQKEIPQDAELNRLTKNIEAALQSSEDLLKKIVADAKEAGMEIKSSAFTSV